MSDHPSLVLVVDDNAANRDVLLRRLVRYGHQVETAADGREALRLIHEKKFDLLLLDIMMPGMDGYQVLKRIKDDPDLRYLPVIVISALDNMESVVQCIELGAEDYLSKPFNPLLLRARISASLEKKRLRDKERAYLEEQATSQRIDRDLNTRLDIKRTSQITLDWAVRRSRVAAALIGLVQNDVLEVAASRGYTEVLKYYENGAIPIRSLPMRRAIETILPQATTDVYDFILPNTQKQVIMPIGRAGEVIALLILESEDAETFDNALLSFLTRLSDRAAIALSNALLYEAVQAANVAKSEFVSEVSHELKNPMTSILNYAKMLKGAGPINTEQASFIKTIVNNVNRMKQIVADLSDLSKIEAGHAPLEPAATDITDVIYEVVLAIQGQVDEKKQTLEMRLAEDLPAVWADPDRLAQILTNLVSNAHKYTPAGGNIIIRADRLTGQLNEPDKVQISVEDNGIGLRPEDQVKIFQKYFRAADSKDQTPGTGLGLHITKTLVELHGGEIWFESEHGQGTSFHFTLPLAL